MTQIPETITMAQLRAAFEVLGMPRPELCTQLTIVPDEIRLTTADIEVSPAGFMNLRSAELFEHVIPLTPGPR